MKEWQLPFARCRIILQGGGDIGFTIVGPLL